MSPRVPVPAVSLSVVIATRNRARRLAAALNSLAGQDAPVPFEVIVADNGSSDDTPAVVRNARHRHGEVRLYVEPAGGVSNARNTGAHTASGSIVAFMDDDQIAHPGWVRAIHREFSRAEAPDFAGGRNLPPPGTRLPEWVTSDLRGALSLLDRGDEPLPIDRSHWMTLAGGNMACWKHVFERVGGFRPYPRSQDRELTLRLLLAGYGGRYVPDMVMYHPVDGRVTREHFRRWNAAEGRMRAHYRFLERFDGDGRLLAEPPSRRRLAGVSLFVYRQWLEEVRSWAAAVVRGQSAAAFRHELKARHIFHYVLGVARGAGELRT